MINQWPIAFQRNFKANWGDTLLSTFHCISSSGVSLDILSMKYIADLNFMSFWLPPKHGTYTLVYISGLSCIHQIKSVIHHTVAHDLSQDSCLVIHRYVIIPPRLYHNIHILDESAWSNSLMTWYRLVTSSISSPPNSSTQSDPIHPL